MAQGNVTFTTPNSIFYISVSAQWDMMGNIASTDQQGAAMKLELPGERGSNMPSALTNGYIWASQEPSSGSMDF